MEKWQTPQVKIPVWGHGSACVNNSKQDIRKMNTIYSRIYDGNYE
jgi:hypothetical protein